MLDKLFKKKETPTTNQFLSIEWVEIDYSLYDCYRNDGTVPRMVIVDKNHKERYFITKELAKQLRGKN